MEPLCKLGEQEFLVMEPGYWKGAGGLSMVEACALAHYLESPAWTARSEASFVARVTGRSKAQVMKTGAVAASSP